MKKLIIAFLLLLPHLSFAYTVIADWDDTIKISHSEHMTTGAIRGLLSKRIFSGAKNYLTGVKAHHHQLILVSASPEILRDKIQETLHFHQIMADHIFLNKQLTLSKFKYKVGLIRKILAESSDDVILFGDDVGEDPEVYQEISKLFPDRVLAIYIRPILNRSFKGQRIHATIDLAVNEFWNNRLDLMTVVDILADHLKDKIQLLIPSFSWCPDALASQSHEWPEYEQINHRLKSHCAKRQTKTIQ